MSDDESQQPGGGRLLDEVQLVDNADAEVICPLCHLKMAKVDGKAHGLPAVPKHSEYFRGSHALAYCQSCDVTQQWSFTRMPE